MENELLQQILLELKELRQGQEKLEQGQLKLEQRQANLEQSIKEIKSDVKVIKKDVKSLYSLSNAAFDDILMLDERTLVLKEAK